MTSIYIDRKVTLDLRFVTVTEVLEKICEQVGYHYYIEPGWVEISEDPKPVSERGSPEVKKEAKP